MRTPIRPYRVLMFTVDLTRSSWLDSRSAALTRPGILLLDDEGRSLGHVRGQGDERVEAATDLAEKAWQTKKTFAPFTVQVGDQQFGCSFMQYPLNGQQLNTGVVLNTDRLIDWLLPEWRVLIASAVFLLVLITLLTWAYLKKRSSDENLRKQTRRTRTQEVKLAKALGERDVLNREVHHRVKNNLQVVSSLLNLQATHLEDGAVKSEFLRGKRRIDTIALVHHKLYGLVDHGTWICSASSPIGEGTGRNVPTTKPSGELRGEHRPYQGGSGYSDRTGHHPVRTRVEQFPACFPLRYGRPCRDPC
ncbi:MAG: hypothetical protein IPF64_18035 [Flavobacteriales bacterium]|nr:hypothetical protein [Flavobacteriales bacterium]